MPLSIPARVYGGYVVFLAGLVAIPLSGLTMNTLAVVGIGFGDAVAQGTLYSSTLSSIISSFLGRGLCCVVLCFVVVIRSTNVAVN